MGSEPGPPGRTREGQAFPIGLEDWRIGGLGLGDWEDSSLPLHALTAQGLGGFLAKSRTASPAGSMAKCLAKSVAKSIAKSIATCIAKLMRKSIAKPLVEPLPLSFTKSLRFLCKYPQQDMMCARMFLRFPLPWPDCPRTPVSLGNFAIGLPRDLGLLSKFAIGLPRTRVPRIAPGPRAPRIDPGTRVP